MTPQTTARIADLKAKLASRKRRSGLSKNIAAIETEIARLEKLK
jgi:hypothetical protein